MKKRLYGVVLAVIVIFAFTACGKKKGNNFATATPAQGNSQTGMKTGKDLYHECGGEVVLGDYSKLTKPEEQTAVTDEEVEEEFKAQLEAALADYPNYIHDPERDGSEVKEGDTVNIDFVGKLDGVAFEGGTDSDYDLTVGSGSFIADFENGLIGKTVGTTVDINATFPEDYRSTGLAGKTVVFTVTLNYIGQKKDDADDEYIRRISKGAYTGLDNYKEKLREMMESDAAENYEDNLYDSVISQMVELSEFKTILDEDVSFYEEDILSYYNTYASYRGMTVQDLAPMVGFDSYDAFLQETHDNAVSYVKEYMVLQAVVKKENLTLSDAKFDELLEGYMASAGSTDREAFIEEYSREYLEYCMKNDLALEFLIEKAKAN